MKTMHRIVFAAAAAALVIGTPPALARRDPTDSSSRPGGGGGGASQRSAPSGERRDWSPRQGGDTGRMPWASDYSRDQRSDRSRRDYSPPTGNDHPNWSRSWDRYYPRHRNWRGSYYYYGWYPYWYWPYRSWYWGPSFSFYYGYDYYPRDYYYYDRAAPTYPTPQGQQTYYQIGVLWGVDLNHKVQPWSKFVAYLRDNVLTAERINQDEFRRGFILGYGEGAETTFEKALQEATAKK
jgi:hypothetical protein